MSETVPIRPGDTTTELALPHHKMQGWWWYGPIPVPEGVVLLKYTDMEPAQCHSPAP